MVPPRSLPASSVCWRRQSRFPSQRRGYVHRALLQDRIASKAVSRPPRRALHVSQSHTQVVPSSTRTTTTTPPIDPSLLRATEPQKPGIRGQLEQWQQQFGGPDEAMLKAFENHPMHGEMENNMSKLSFSSKADEEHGIEPELDEDNEGEELITIGLFLRPGDVVELSQPGREPVLAVFVQQLDMISQFFSVNGRWVHSLLSGISFTVPRCVDPALLQPLLPYMPTKLLHTGPKDALQVPRELAAPVQAVLQELTEESERIYRTNAPVLDTAYSVLADATRPRMMTLSQIAKTLLGKRDPAWSPSPAALLAVRKALNHNEFRFRSDYRSQRLTNVFAIRPKNDVEVVETVQGWIREYNEYLASLANDHISSPRRSKGATYVVAFIEKSRRLIATSRKDRDPNHGCVGPSRTRPTSSRQQQSFLRLVIREDFTDSDRQIINFLHAWVLTAQFQRMPNLYSACTSILHAIGLYEEDTVNIQGLPVAMGRAMGNLFLQEIGVITPHENRALYDEHLMLPTVRLSRNLELLNTKAELTRKTPDFRDSMADLRRDWGSTTVFCIDASDAKEIDDGVSVERIPGKDSEFWLHVHVANPTAFFDKTHVLSGLAAHMTSTVYTPERTFPMLPTWVSQNYFSLGRNRPVITFSSRVDASGNVVETKIQHGIVRKVVSITPSEVSEYLGEYSNGSVSRFVVGGEVPTKKSSRSTPRLTPDQLQNLQDMYTVAKARWKARRAAGAVRFDLSPNEVRLYESPQQTGMTWMPPSLDKARFIQGDPIIEITNEKARNGNEIDATNIVEECMLTACSSAASWCAERNIPVMFRGTIEPPSRDLSLEQFKEQILNPHMDKYGSLSPGLQLRYLKALGRAIAHSSPLPHKIIGTPAYVKVTSPLRRFSDMIAHWQIEAAIRYEERTGTMLNSAVLASAPRSILPFSLRQMQESIITLSPRERIIGQTNALARHFWIVQAYMRAFYYKEAHLPDTFNVWIRHAGDGIYTTGYTIDQSIKVKIRDLKDSACVAGDQWAVKIHSIDVFSGTINVTPIELLHRDAGEI
ncbi:RNB-domain-containing protein [Lentithecium fluviatile CBS 122367]|uniref:RNB-domain-containing protein n=1 Tax=Lentithecium fluviatile CBS 122367 TaxID=1168545 RepID=A0A6G1IKU7_9PLEO|nr:RNB-domain-containing protein [Lentithecium fluviatile CBS 122367]